jgi:hypothetical protein
LSEESIAEIIAIFSLLHETAGMFCAVHERREQHGGNSGAKSFRTAAAQAGGC